MRHDTDSGAELQEIAKIDGDSEVDKIEAADAALPSTTAVAVTPSTTAAAVTQSTAVNTATPSTSSGTQSTPDEPHIKSVKRFWKDFNIRQAVDFMVKAWHNISVATIQHTWEKLLPEKSEASPVQPQVQR
ncbi:hypothetical protein Pcinc_022819 [Petrolisthes cinctipes]|uniref:DDE-1 domain-containing protein n=1 Tax=Petrolisthes cinctipes TaxID=88211 RepID=A0AAE1KGL2_PETCI|nr:hypothetical protein Pcinc_022819 [Petrolisthes cinctipes]